MPPKTSPFPEPLVYPPLSLPHLQTCILLHGRGSNPARFGPELITTPFPTNKPSPFSPPLSTPTSPSPPIPPSPFPTLRHHHLHTKFLFPSALYSRATIYKRSLITQWFDSHLPPYLHPGLQIPGLQQTTSYLHDLIRREAKKIPSGERGIVLGGISQGCAAALVAGLLWEGGRLGGLVGICGWLPYGRELGQVVVDAEGDGEGVDVFERAEGEGDGLEERDVGAVAVGVLREMLEMEGKGDGSRPEVFNTPVFLGHGDEDEKVPVQLGKASSETLTFLGFDVEWHGYEGLGHWFSSDMIADMAHFLDEKANWNNE